MKLTKDIALILMQESASFRKYVVEQLFEATSLVPIIVSICAKHGRNKIAAIKELREFASHRRGEFIDEFGADCWYYNPTGNGHLGLGAAKGLVEKYGNYN